MLCQWRAQFGAGHKATTRRPQVHSAKSRKIVLVFQPVARADVHMDADPPFAPPPHRAFLRVVASRWGATATSLKATTDQTGTRTRARQLDCDSPRVDQPDCDSLAHR